MREALTKVLAWMPALLPGDPELADTCIAEIESAKGPWYAETGYCPECGHGALKAESARLRSALREIVEAVEALRNVHTGARWQTREIQDRAWRGLIDPLARAEAALRGEGQA